MVKRRKHGYLEALRGAGLPIDWSLVACGKIDFDIGYQAAIDFLRSPAPPDAFLTFNDVITYAVFDAIKSMGLCIPDDVSIIGFTDSDTASFVTPKLSVIADQAHTQGMKACELLMKSISGDRKIYREVVPMQLIIRESSIKNK